MRSRRSSLSSVIENNLKAITENTDDSKGLSVTLKSSKGAFKMPENFDYKKDLASRLSEKHL